MKSKDGQIGAKHKAPNNQLGGYMVVIFINRNLGLIIWIQFRLID